MKQIYTEGRGTKGCGQEEVKKGVGTREQEEGE